MIIYASNSDKEIQIDEKDKDICKYDWRISSIGYVRATINGKRWFLHRYLLKPKEGMQVDHINGNTLDNRRDNLRICSIKENRRNSKKRKTQSSSKYKGVSYCSTEKRRKRWKAACEIDNKDIYAGRFYTEEEAKEAYNKKAKELFGEFAKIN